MMAAERPMLLCMAILLPSLVGAFIPLSSSQSAVPLMKTRRGTIEPPTTIRHLDLTGIPIEPTAVPDAVLLPSGGGGDDLTTMLSSTVLPLATLVVGALVIAELAKEAPTGWVMEDVLEAAPSTLGPKAGRGLFTTADIPAGTIIGSFPGYRLTRQAFAARKRDEEAQLLSLRYAWRLTGGDLIDPTDDSGTLIEVLLGYGGIIRIPTLLALVNEPPPGYDVNLVAVVNEKEVLYQAERDILQGEELFIDYGPDYPRSYYRN